VLGNATLRLLAQFSRAGDRQRDRALIGLACYSSPHFGGAVVYSAEPFYNLAFLEILRDS
jgi:hypothetical protein